jgi:hypothetical protein
MVLTASEPVFDVAVIAAVLPPPIPVNLELLATVLADYFVERTALY